MSSFLLLAIAWAVPVLFAVLGEILTEKSGTLNLGVEGMMLMGACVGFITGFHTQNAVLAILGAFAAGSFGGFIFSILTVSLKANQIVTGLTLTIFGGGFAKFIGDNYIGETMPDKIQSFFTPLKIPLLSDIPIIGESFFRQDILVYFSYFLIIIMCIYMYKTTAGLNMRGIGESAAAADASSINVNFQKHIHIIIGGGLCGIGGAYISLIYVPSFQEDLVLGRGWIAIALVIFASWNPAKAFLGALLFGILSVLGLRLQSLGIHISQFFVDMVPYLATIVVVILGTRKNKPENTPPADLSVNYFREER
jgi:simple sugar transport system permease protein